jgi:hypothetical protein
MTKQADSQSYGKSNSNVPPYGSGISENPPGDTPPGEPSPPDWSTPLVMPEVPSETPPGDTPPGEPSPPDWSTPLVMPEVPSETPPGDTPPGEPSPPDWSTPLVMPEVPSETPPGDTPPGEQNSFLDVAEESLPRAEQSQFTNEIDSGSKGLTYDQDVIDLDHAHAEMESYLNSPDLPSRDLDNLDIDQAHAEIESVMSTPTRQDSSLDQAHEQINNDMAMEAPLQDNSVNGQDYNQDLGYTQEH